MAPRRLAAEDITKMAIQLDPLRTCYYLTAPCPRCGALLASDGRRVWCARLPEPCGFGHERQERVEVFYRSKQDGDER